ncbi:MAG: c-type cytochrome, partial [Candidatus Binatia bacterium]
TWRAIRPRLVVEAAFAASAVALAAAMAGTVPAAHDVVSWWLPFRFSLRATWSLPGVAERVIAGGVVLSVYASVAAGRLWRGDLRQGAIVAAAGVAFAAALGLPPLGVRAYPSTYWTPAVAFDAVSVANGRNLFRSHCVSCHGLAGRGDGPLAGTLPKPPANLSEPHTADHTAGDIFWWLTYGMPESGMQAFDLLSPDERWDLINYLRAFAAGYQARILSARVSPGQPWLGAVDFAFTTTTGETGLLRDFRERSAVLLVLFSPRESAARLAELGKGERALRSAGAEILAVPIRPVEEESAALPSLRTVAAEAPEIVATYVLFRRTFADPGNDSDDDVPAHLELLIDRFGYVRARWRPDHGEKGWDDLGLPLEQVRILAAEPQLRPPPEDHVH